MMGPEYSHEASSAPPSTTGSSRVNRKRWRKELDERPSWACPFYKNQPRLYPGCRNRKLVRLADITQHIARLHQVPIHCPKCGLVFKHLVLNDTPDLQRQAHLQEDACHRREFNYPGVTLAQMNALRETRELERMPGQNGDERRWYSKYSIVFPEARDLPNSPYMASEQVSEPVIHEVQALLDSHSELQLGDIMSALEGLGSTIQTGSQHSPPLDVPNLSTALGELHMQLQPPHPVAEVPHHDLKDSIQKPSEGKASIHGASPIVMDHDEAGRLFPASVPYSDSGYGTASRCSALDLGKRAEITGVSSANTQETDQQDDDAKTVYSDTTSLSNPIYGKYAAALAEDMSNGLGVSVLDPQVVARLSATLPRLLRALALSIGYQAPSQTNRDVMVFICRHRNEIASLFHESYTHQQFEPERERVVTWQILERWLLSNDESEPVSPPSPPDEVDLDLGDDVFSDEPDEELVIPRLEEYTQFISGSPGYSWLRDQLRREALMESPGRDVLDEVRNKILSTIPTPRRISRKTSLQGCTVVYTVDWSPTIFLHEQNYDQSESDDSAIANAVTLTGLCDNAYALSCREYLSQTWPQTGKYTLRLMQSLLASGQSANRVCTSRPFTGLTLSASLAHSSLYVKATGVPDFVTEIGEQLAWLGAALRSGPNNVEKVIYCVPRVNIQSSSSSRALNQGTKHEDCIVQCNIEFDFEDCESFYSIDESGRCWYGFFRRAVIARGFPTPSRPKRSTGLEMPLNMMTALADTKYIQKFGGKIFIKGFSTMLVPTEVCDGLLLWHLLHTNDANTRISYLDCHLEHAEVELAALQTYRHVVGWCSEVISHVGSISAEYDIGRSHLQEAGSESSMEKLEIQTGYFVNATAVFSLGNREKPVHISRHGYLTKLQWISSKHLIFWDEGDKRGWLVNGADALLHLLRASLHHSKRKFGSAFLLDPACVVEPPTAIHQDPPQNNALQLLTDPSIRYLRLFVEDISTYDQETHDPKASRIPCIVPIKETRYYRLQDRVEHIYSTLEKLIDHKTDMERKNGLHIKKRLRRHLDGWDFRDIATDSDPFFPRVSTLQTIGKGWVDFVRAIHAVTLFGRGFGELLQPMGKTSACPHWSSLPRNRFYLAARVADLQQIMSEEGDTRCNPRKLCHNVLWHMRQTTFEGCPCTTNQGAKHHDPVQAMFPAKFASCLRKKEGTVLEDNGAVIFGHNMSLHWHWRDEGDPVKGDPPIESESEAGSLEEGSMALSSQPPVTLNGSMSTTTLSNRSSSLAATSGSPPDSTVNSIASDITRISQKDESEVQALPGIRAGKHRLQETLSFVSKRLKF